MLEESGAAPDAQIDKNAAQVYLQEYNISHHPHGKLHSWHPARPNDEENAQ